MWPFRKPPPPEPPRELHYGTTELQVGDECVCVDDRPHGHTHQKLLSARSVYKVREVAIGDIGSPGGYCGPWIRLDGIVPVGDRFWVCDRFEKVIKLEKKSSILTQVMEPAGLDVAKEKREAKKIYS